MRCSFVFSIYYLLKTAEADIPTKYSLVHQIKKPQSGNPKDVYFKKKNLLHGN